MMMMKLPLTCLLVLLAGTHAFQQQVSSVRSPSVIESFSAVSQHQKPAFRHQSSQTTQLAASNNDNDSNNNDKYHIQILMSDTGGGHRASANALRDAFDILYPGKIECDIVDIFTEYAPVWPINQAVAAYKIMAKYPILWDIFYHSGATPFGLWMGKTVLELTCFDAFEECLNRPSSSSNKRRADMVVSVHPLCQDVPLRALAHLDSRGATRDVSARTTPFCTVVTDLGGAHPTWFNPG